MADQKTLFALLSVFMLLPFPGCSGTESNQELSPFRQLPELRDVKPEKPVKIKLRRNVSGSYSWELTGDNAKRILDVDEKLRKVLKE